MMLALEFISPLNNAVICSHHRFNPGENHGPKTSIYRSSHAGSILAKND
jgi:hypothetical protein